MIPQSLALSVCLGGGHSPGGRRAAPVPCFPTRASPGRWSPAAPARRSASGDGQLSDRSHRPHHPCLLHPSDPMAPNCPLVRSESQVSRASSDLSNRVSSLQVLSRFDLSHSEDCLALSDCPVRSHQVLSCLTPSCSVSPHPVASLHVPPGSFLIPFRPVPSVRPVRFISHPVPPSCPVASQ